MELTKTEKINLGTVEIAKRIRRELKTFKGCKFSVTTEHFAGGSSIDVNLMKADRKTVRDVKSISDFAISYLGSRYTRDDINQRQKKKYYQLSAQILRTEFDPETWCNGVFLTEQGHNLLQRVVSIADFYNFDDSDPQIDYFNVNFYFNIELGKWDKAFEDGT